MDLITILLPKNIETLEFKQKLTSSFKSKLRVTPYFRFIDNNLLNQQLFKPEKRKPEKLIYV